MRRIGSGFGKRCRSPVRVSRKVQFMRMGRKVMKTDENWENLKVNTTVTTETKVLKKQRKRKFEKM